MPKTSSARFRVVKAFDFILRPGVVKAFSVGDEPPGLTAAMIERGRELGAIKEIASQEEHTNGKT